MSLTLVLCGSDVPDKQRQRHFRPLPYTRYRTYFWINLEYNDTFSFKWVANNESNHGTRNHLYSSVGAVSRAKPMT